MKLWLRRHGMLLGCIFAATLNALSLMWILCGDTSLPQPVPPVSAGGDGKLQALSALLELSVVAQARPLEFPEGELSILSAPPWTKLEQADLAKLAAGYAGKAGLIPELPPLEREKRRDEALEGDETGGGYFPYVYSGGLKLYGNYRALIEDADSGACYFRSDGETLGNFSVSDVKADSLLLIHEKTGKRVRLLKTPGK